MQIAQGNELLIESYLEDEIYKAQVEVDGSFGYQTGIIDEVPRGDITLWRVTAKKAAAMVIEAIKEGRIDINGLHGNNNSLVHCPVCGSGLDININRHED